MGVAAGGFRGQLMGTGIQLKLKKIRVGAQFSFFRKRHSTLTSFIIVFIWLLLLVVPSSVATAATALNLLNKPACLISFNRHDVTALPEAGFEMTHPAIHKANLMPKYIYPSFQKVIRK
jgi:hypothetical protein